MFAACGVTYDDAAGAGGIEIHDVMGVPVPFASARLLWRMKQTVRDKDIADRAWLRSKLGLAEGDSRRGDTVTVPRWLWFGMLGLTLALGLAWVWWLWLRPASGPPAP